jgi:hypothetical protein
VPSSEQVVLVGEPVVVQLNDALVEVVEEAGVDVRVTVGPAGGGGCVEPVSARVPKFCVQ